MLPIIQSVGGANLILTSYGIERGEINRAKIKFFWIFLMKDKIIGFFNKKGDMVTTGTTFDSTKEYLQDILEYIESGKIQISLTNQNIIMEQFSTC